VNRREFLLALGVAACGPRTPLNGGRKQGRGSAAVPEDAGGSIADDWSNRRTTQFNATPLFVRGEQLVRRTRDELQFIDVATLRHSDRVTEAYRSASMLSNGTVLAFAHRDQGACELDTFEGTALTHSIPAPDCGSTSGAHIVAAGTSDVYLTDGYDHCIRYRLAGGALTEVAQVMLEKDTRDDMGRAIGLSDGRMLVPGGRRVQAYDGKQVQTYPAPAPVGHVCAGVGNRVWQSLVTKGATPADDPRIDHVALVRLDAPDSPDATLSFAPGRITHMASGGDGSVAIMIFIEKEWAWDLVLLDAGGKERRRIRMPEDLVREVDVDFNAAFVALTPTVALVDADRHGLFGWNISTGARI
jgi:hypothetical protein